MSCVICLATASFSLIAGDGRVRNIETGEIVDEHYPKVVRINQNVIVGFTGIAQICVDALAALPEGIDKMNVTEISKEVFQNLGKIRGDTGCDSSFVFAGVEDGAVVLCSFGRDNGYVYERNKLKEGEILMHCFYPEAVTSNILYECYCELSESGLNEIIKETFRRVASLSDTVNENISLLTVEIPS